jgi:hypothetical protein
MLRELNVVEQRYRAVLEVLSGIPVVEVAERYGVARQSEPSCHPEDRGARRSTPNRPSPLGGSDALSCGLVDDRISAEVANASRCREILFVCTRRGDEQQ